MASCPGCRAGTFGPNCKSRCSCINGGRCDSRTGTCYCAPGFIGADCSSSKSRTPLHYYYYLELVFEGCWPSYLIVSSGQPQPRLKLKGVYLHNSLICNTSAGCLSGYYGKDCGKPCSCGEGGQCHPTTGRCICAPGRMGQSCEQGNSFHQDFPVWVSINLIYRSVVRSIVEGAMTHWSHC